MRLYIFIVCLLVVGCKSSKNVVNTSQNKTVKSAVLAEKSAPIIKKTIEQQKPKIQPEVKVVKAPKVETKVNTVATVSDITQDYIDRFAGIAIEEMNAYKIPASITLAQGVLESGSGRSPLALKSNNHFGIKCHKGWKGKSVSHDDDRLGECFRKYKDPRQSYEDHSKFLTLRSRYASLFKLSITDYIGWAYGLKKAGYATDPKYPKKLINIINKYQLYVYDGLSNTSNLINEQPKVSLTNKSSGNFYVVKKGDTLYSIAKRNQTTVERLVEINGLPDFTIGIGQELLLD